MGPPRWPVHLAIAFVLAIVTLATLLALAVGPLAIAGLVPLLGAVQRLLPAVIRGPGDPPEAPPERPS